MPIPFTAPHRTITSSPPHGSTVSHSSNHNNNIDSNSSTDNNNNNSSTDNISHGADSSVTVGRLSLSPSHSRIQTQTLDSRRWSRLQRRSLLDSHPAVHHHSHHHGHSHLSHSHLSHNHHSPRTRYFASFAPTTQQQLFPANRPSRVLLSPPLPLSPPSSYFSNQQLQSQRFLPSSPPHVRDHDLVVSQQQQTHTQQRQQQQYSNPGDTSSPPFMPFSSSLPPNAHPTAVSNHFPEQNVHPSAPLLPRLPMESSRPSESFNSFLSTSGASAPASLSASINQSDNSALRGSESDPRARVSHPALSSTPMQRTLTNHPAMTPSYSSIHAASMDPSSVSVSVSVSASSPTPAMSSSSTDVRSHRSDSNNGDSQNNNGATMSSRINLTSSSRSNSSGRIVTGSSSSGTDESRHQYGLTQPTSTTTTLPSSSTNNNLSSSNSSNGLSNTEQSIRSEVDDRIHFRLLDGIYFSAPPRSLRHDDDLGMDSPPQPQDRSDLQYIDIQDTRFSDQEDEYMHDNNAMEDLDFGDSPQRHAMFDGQGDEFASVTFPRRPNRPELIEEDEDEELHQRNSRHLSIFQDEDDDDNDDDDGIDQVIEGHRHSAALVRSPSSSLPSHLEHPRHAQLSPRSAAALTSMFTMGRSSWPQPLISSSISSDLITMSQPGARSEYDNNPYYRRPGTSFQGQMDHNRRMDTSGSSHSSRTSMPDRPLWESTTSGPGNAFMPRSISSQHNVVERSAISSHNQFGRRSSTDARGCGEMNHAPSSETRGDVWPLKFDMYYADGGEFNAAHSVENVLKNDSSVYCSRRSTNINICLKLSQPHVTFVLTQFKAKAPTTGFTAPCKEGLIFISHEPIQLEKTAYFDNMTRKMYDEYMDTVQHQSGFGRMYQNHGSSTDALIPAAFFQLGGPDETCTVDFSPNRSGRYLLIKLLRSRCTNSLQRPENIDLQYLGLIGFTGARSFASGGLL